MSIVRLLRLPEGTGVCSDQQNAEEEPENGNERWQAKTQSNEAHKDRRYVAALLCGGEEVTTDVAKGEFYGKAPRDFKKAYDLMLSPRVSCVEFSSIRRPSTSASEMPPLLRSGTVPNGWMYSTSG